MGFRRIAALALAVVIALSLASCKKKDTEENISQPITEQETESAYLSRLTGLPVKKDDVNRRPVAIMINNIKKALPQYGISHAGIIYEALAEGGITRLLAVFEDVSDIPQIGTIRSARPYYLDFAQGLDAVYIHLGGSEEAYRQIKSRGMDSFDLIQGRNNKFYWRDKQRIKSAGYEHSVFTSGEKLLEMINRDGVRMTSDAPSAFKFGSEDDYSGTDAENISVKFSSYKTGTYTYDKDNKVYRIGQYGKAHTDALENAQLAFKNIFILNINSYVIKGDTAGRLDLDTVGSGNGTYIVNGTAKKIIWKKDSKSAPFKYFTEDGTELSVVPGDSYVAIVPLNAEIQITGAAAEQ